MQTTVSAFSFAEMAAPEAAPTAARARKEKIPSARSATELMLAFQEHMALPEGERQAAADLLADELSRRYRADRAKHDKWAVEVNVLGAKSVLVALEGMTDEPIVLEVAKFKKLVAEDAAKAASLQRLREAAKQLSAKKRRPVAAAAAGALTEEVATASVGVLVRMACADATPDASAALTAVCDALHVILEATARLTKALAAAPPLADATAAEATHPRAPLPDLGTVERAISMSARVQFALSNVKHAIMGNVDHRKPWTPETNAKLEEAYKEHGMAATLEGRSATSIKYQLYKILHTKYGGVAEDILAAFPKLTRNDVETLLLPNHKPSKRKAAGEPEAT